MVKRISHSSAGTSRIARHAPAKSTGFGTPSAWTISGSGMSTVSMWPSDRTVDARAATREGVMPSCPMARPASTEVTMKLSPVTMPTTPFARSRPSSGTRMVTTVERAMPRADSMMPPASRMRTNATNGGLPRVSRSARGVAK